MSGERRPCLTCGRDVAVLSGPRLSHRGMVVSLRNHYRPFPEDAFWCSAPVAAAPQGDGSEP